MKRVRLTGRETQLGEDIQSTASIQILDTRGVRVITLSTIQMTVHLNLKSMKVFMEKVILVLTKGRSFTINPNRHIRLCLVGSEPEGLAQIHSCYNRAVINLKMKKGGGEGSRSMGRARGQWG